LFYDTNASTMNNGSSGYFSMTLATNGAYSCYILNGGASNAFNSLLGVEASSPFAFTYISNSGYILEFSVDTTTAAVSGFVSNSAGAWHGELAGYLASHTSLNGTYLMTMPGFSDPAAGPAGDSIFSVTVSSAGLVSLNGTMADGTAALQSSLISQNGYYPLYVPLYGNGSLGSLLGWVDFVAGTNALSTNSALTWFNLSGATSLYPNGFTNQGTPTASLYNSNTLWTLANASVILTGGDLQTNLTNTVTVSNNVITVTPATNGLSLTINRSTGEISGSFVDPNSDKTNAIYGAVLQNDDTSSGYFLGTDQGGSFILIGN
jgi:hypothetical protein